MCRPQVEKEQRLVDEVVVGVDETLDPFSFAACVAVRGPFVVHCKCFASPVQLGIAKMRN